VDCRSPPTSAGWSRLNSSAGKGWAWCPPTRRPKRSRRSAALAAVRASIDELDAIAGRLAGAAVAHGGSWDEVAGRLRIDPARAEAAYGSSTTERG